MRGQYGLDLRQVGTPVDALQEHHVDLFEQLVDRAHDPHAHLLQVRGVAGHAVKAGDRHVGAAAGKGRHQPHVGQIAYRLGVGKGLGEGGRVGSVEPDHACAKRFVSGLGKSGNGGHARRQGERPQHYVVPAHRCAPERD